MKIALTLLALLLVPVAAPAQTVAKAGVVTTLEGNVTARRVALPDPVPLKFKDDVFLQDTVTTGDKSLARMLLGGKAVVTVRERSVLTITEIPGRTTIELANGKFALAVARERMQPGDEIQIRTPNAIAGVRGTVVITEVLRQGAQTAGIPAVVTNFYVLRGTITAQPLGPSGSPSGAPLSIGAMQSYSGAGAAQPRVAPIPPEQVAQITSGLQPTGPKGGSEAGQEQAKGQAMQATLALLGALTGGSTDTLAQAIVAPAATTNLFGTSALTSTTTAPPIIPPISEALLSEEIQALIDASRNAIEVTGPLTVPAGSSLKKFKGTTVSKATVPLVTLRNARIQQLGSDDLIGADADAAVLLAGSLAEVIDSEVETGGAFFGVRGGTVVSTGTTPFIFFDPVTVTTADSLIALTGGNLALAGALFQDVGGTLDIGGHLLLVASGILVGTGADALIQLSETTVTAGSNLIQANGLIQGTDPTLIALAGPLLLSQNSAIVAASNLVRIAEGAGIFSTTTSPLVTIIGGSFKGGGTLGTSSGGSLLRMFSQVGRPGSTLTLAGPFASIANATIITTDSDTFNIADGSTITSTTASPFASFTGGTVTAAFNFFDLQTLSSFGVPATVGNGLPATMSLAGSLVDATGTTFNIQGGSFFRMRNGVSLTQTGASPLFRLTGVTAHPTANFAQLSSGTAESPQLSLGGQLLVAVNSTLSSGDPLSNTSSFLIIFDGATVTSTTLLPFLSFEGSSVDTAGNILTLRRSRAGQPSKLTLAGPLLSAINSSFNHTSLGFGTACCNAFSIAQGAELVSTTTSALIQLVNSTITGFDAQSGGNFFGVNDSSSAAGSGELVAPARVSLAGPLLSATNSTITALFNLLAVTNSTFSSTTTSALIALNGGTMTLGGPDPTASNAAAFARLLLSSSTGLPTAPTTVTLAGPLLRAVDASLTASAGLIGVFSGATLTSTSTAALLQFVNTIVSNGAAVPVGQGAILGANLVGGPSGTDVSRITLSGPLLSSIGGSFTLAAGIIDLFTGATLSSTTTDPLVSFTGGTHSFGLRSLVHLLGRTTNTELDAASGLTVGADRMLSTGGVVLEGSGTTISTSVGVTTMDTALLEATAPLLHLKSGSSMTTAADALDLVQRAKLTSVGPVFKLDASTLNVNSGALGLVRGGSVLRVTGDFLQLLNGSTLNLLNGPVLSITGNSVVNISGAFANFGGTGGNAINVTNNICLGAGSSCTNFGNNLIIHATGGATVSVSGTPIKNTGLGAINPSANAAVITVTGASSSLTITGNP